MKSINTKSTSLIIRQMVLTLLVIFILDLCHICHQDTCSVQKARVIPKKICIAYPWSAVSIFNISESILAKVPTRRSFLTHLSTKNNSTARIEIQYGPFLKFQRPDDSSLRKPEDDKIDKFSKKIFRVEGRESPLLIRAIKTF